MRAPALALLLLLNPALAVTPIAQTAAIEEAVRTGEIIGGAGACGVSEDRRVAVGRKVMARLRDMGVSADELRRAQAFHEQAILRSAERIRAGEGNCGEALSSFAALEAG